MNQAMYWLLGAFFVLSAVLVAWKFVENDIWKWLFYPNMMKSGVCTFVISYFMCPLIWLAVAILKGFVLYASGYAIWSSILISTLIAFVYPIALLTVCLAIVIAVVLLVFLYYFFLLFVYCIRGEINKAKRRRQAKKQAEKEQNQ